MAQFVGVACVYLTMSASVLRSMIPFVGLTDRHTVTAVKLDAHEKRCSMMENVVHVTLSLVI